jgi:hypothetical protein
LDIYLGKVGDMGLFFAYIWHTTPFLFAFSPPEWGKIIWRIYPGLKGSFL